MVLRYSGASELQRDFEANLRRGRAFVPGVSGLQERAPCLLRIEHPNDGAVFELAAEAVWISEQPGNFGTGVEIVQFDAGKRASLQAFVEAHRDAAAPVSAPASSACSASSREPASSSSSGARNLHDRVRDLGSAERDSLARHGSMPERVALERRFGSAVWEGLLQNPQLTTREVCQMAKSPSLPTHLVNSIVSNAGWLADAGVRSALLANPRVSGASLDRVLRALPQAELSKVAEQTNLRQQVRAAAKRLIRR
ncbi:MAG TPA: hypothetical protein VG963_28390 [Polyangiaceae bacterium]|nr:hypothetical protein [Polyangiaceae bacterium]